MGSADCFCPAGYEGDGINFCGDRDECNLDEDNCSPNATCLNSQGSFSCECNASYVGDGVTCMLLENCGNAAVEGQETCDDGNMISADGCSAGCRMEFGYACSAFGGNCSDATGGLVVHLALEGDTLNDLSGRGHDLSNSVASFTVPDRFGIGGDARNVAAAQPAALANSNTIPLIGGSAWGLSFWAKLDAPATGSLVERANVMALRVDGCSGSLPGILAFEWRSGGPAICLETGAPAISDDRWHHIALSSDGGLLVTVNVDGVGYDLNLSGPIDVDNSTPIQLAASSAYDDLRFFTRPIDAAMLEALQFGNDWTPGPAVCGDGRVSSSESCDDGNTGPADGCDAACLIEPGHMCENPFNCLVACGDGVLDVAPLEQCDDGGRVPGDGCDEFCQTE